MIGLKKEKLIPQHTFIYTYILQQHFFNFRSIFENSTQHCAEVHLYVCVMYSLFGGHDGIRVKLLEVIKKYMQRQRSPAAKDRRIGALLFHNGMKF